MLINNDNYKLIICQLMIKHSKRLTKLMAVGSKRAELCENIESSLDELYRHLRRNVTYKQSRQYKLLEYSKLFKRRMPSWLSNDLYETLTEEVKQEEYTKEK